MRYITFEAHGEKQPGFIASDGRYVSVASALPSFAGKTMNDVIEAGPDVWKALSEAYERSAEYPSYAPGSVRLLSPIERPRHDILCVGVNYADHLAETRAHLKGNETISSAKAVYFSKRASRIIGPDEAIKARLDLDPSLDYEVEIAVIIGREGKNIPVEETEKYIFGYSVFNDISSRALQSQHGQWFLGKSVDTYSAMGPVIVTSDELKLPFACGVHSVVNGELRQNSNSANLIHGIPELVSELSCAFALYPGDIIATGTPSGVGMGFTPPKFLKDGDTVTCEVEGIGALTNHVCSVTD